MNDLLGTVKRRKAKDDSDEERGDDDDGDDEAQGAGGEDAEMEKFFSDVSTLKGQLDKIKLGLRKLEQAHEESKTVTRTNKMKELRERMERAGTEVTQQANEAKLRLEALEKSNAAALKKKGCGEGSNQARTRGSITMSLTKKLRDLMGSFSELREKLKTEYKDVVERRFQAIHGKKARPRPCTQLCWGFLAPAQKMMPRLRWRLTLRPRGSV